MHNNFFESNKSAKDYINESSLSRIWQHIENPNSTFGVVSAFLPPDRASVIQNEERHNQLRKQIRSLGYGYIEQHSGYSYADEREQVVEEKSFFIPNITLKDILFLGKEYDQESVLFKDSNQFSLIYTNHKYGQISMSFSKKGSTVTMDKNILKYAYSQLVKANKSQKVKFAYVMEHVIPNRTEALLAQKTGELAKVKYISIIS